MLGISGGSAGGTVAPFDPSITVASSSTIASGVSPEDWQGRGYVTRRTDDVLVLVYRIGSGHNTAAELAIKFSDDEGATWTAQDTDLDGNPVEGFPMSPPVGTISYGEGVVLTAANGDLLIEMWSVTGISSSGTLNGTYQSRSTDQGSTWSDPEFVTFAGNPYTQVRTFMSDDYFVYEQTIYMGARYYVDGDGVPSASLLMKSTDNGASWDFVSIVQDTDEFDGGQEFGMEYVGNDTIVTMIRNNHHTQCFRRISTDMGATWGTLDTLTGQVGIAARQKIYTRSHLQGHDGWWKDPVLFMGGFVHQSAGDSQPRRSCVWFSPDRGITWTGPHYVDSTTDDAGYGDLFWDRTNDRLVMVNYYGTLTAAVEKQYNLTVSLT
jgi:hypothetical protein